MTPRSKRLRSRGLQPIVNVYRIAKLLACIDLILLSCGKHPYRASGAMSPTIPPGGPSTIDQHSTQLQTNIYPQIGTFQGSTYPVVGEHSATAGGAMPASFCPPSVTAQPGLSGFALPQYQSIDNAQKYSMTQSPAVSTAYVGSLYQPGLAEVTAPQNQFMAPPSSAAAIGYPATSHTIQPLALAVLTPGGTHAAAAHAPPASGCTCSAGWVLFGVRCPVWARACDVYIAEATIYTHVFA